LVAAVAAQSAMAKDTMQSMEFIWPPAAVVRVNTLVATSIM
jgi:hypothetical protein